MGKVPTSLSLLKSNISSQSPLWSDFQLSSSCVSLLPRFPVLSITKFIQFSIKQFPVFSVLRWKTETNRLCQFRQPRTTHLLKENTFFLTQAVLCRCFLVQQPSHTALTLQTGHLKAKITMPKLGTMGVVGFCSLSNLLSASLTGTYSCSLASTDCDCQHKHRMMSAATLTRCCAKCVCVLIFGYFLTFFWLLSISLYHSKLLNIKRLGKYDIYPKVAGRNC